MKKYYKGDVEWYDIKYINTNKKAKPIAYSTKATRDLISVLAEESNCTIRQLYDAINYDIEAKEILNKYISLGYGDLIAKKYFKY